MKKIISIGIIVFVIIGCKTIYNNESLSNQKDVISEVSSTDSILSLEFYIYKNKPVDSIALFKYSVVKGYLNLDYFTSVPTIPEDHLKCSILDENKNIIKSMLIENPLHMHAEYTEGDNYQVLKKKTINLEEQYFSLRTNYSESFRYVLFETLDNNNDIYLYPIMSIY